MPTERTNFLRSQLVAHGLAANRPQHRSAARRFRLLLMTATEPTLNNGQYPTARQIADAWRTDNQRNVSYFCNNHAFGISGRKGVSSKHRKSLRWSRIVAGGIPGVDLPRRRTILQNMARIEELTREAVSLPKEQRLALARALLDLEPAVMSPKSNNLGTRKSALASKAVDEGQVTGIAYEDLPARDEFPLRRMTIRVVPEARASCGTPPIFTSNSNRGSAETLAGSRRTYRLDCRSQRGAAPAAGGYRRVNLRIFPYYIAYIIRSNGLWILAIAHTHRRPEYWIEREKTII